MYATDVLQTTQTGSAIAPPPSRRYLWRSYLCERYMWNVCGAVMEKVCGAVACVHMAWKTSRSSYMCTHGM